jgi:predicted ester cyclase
LQNGRQSPLGGKRLWTRRIWLHPFRKAGEKRRLKLSVFSTVMQNRHFLASRLGFDCSPKGKFLGLDVNGKRVPFDKNVFYEYQTKKIWRVWSVIDKAAIEAQLYGET